MSAEAFDRKFGSNFVTSAPAEPGVYRYLGKGGSVLYVGKAKSLRRRLASYRNASRKKVHRKMRFLVREAHSLQYETCESEQAALLREGELIRALRPPYNVEGAYAFLYPYVGWGEAGPLDLLCFTTDPSAFEHLGLQWFGCFRSRPRVKLGFGALVDLLSLIGHRETVQRLPSYPRIKGSRLVGFRQLPRELTGELPLLMSGRDEKALSRVAKLLLGKARALRAAGEVQENLQRVLRFFKEDARPLRQTLSAAGEGAEQVSQEERDALFIRASFAGRAGP